MRPRDDRIPLRDDALAGMHLILDPDELAGWLGERTRVAWSVSPIYLRYKPSTSLVMSLRATTESGGSPHVLECVARTYSADASDKLEKTLERVPREHTIAYDRERRLLVTTAAGDRDLPLLARLARRNGLSDVVERLLPERPELAAGSLRTLTHNPERRWVGLLQSGSAEPVLLRGYPRGRLRRRVRYYGWLADQGPRTPRLLAVSRRYNVAAVEWMAGDDLSTVADLGAWTAAGAALGQLHQCDHNKGRSAATPAAEAADVRRAAHLLSILVPDLTGDIDRLAGSVARLLDQVARDEVLTHGDFSADQVVVGPDGQPSLIDLERMRRGPSAADLGCAAASARTHGESGATPERGEPELQALLAGYGTVRRPPDVFAVSVHELAFRLRKAAEPFRRCVPGWPDLVAQRVAAAERALGQVSDDRAR